VTGELCALLLQARNNLILFPMGVMHGYQCFHALTSTRNLSSAHTHFEHNHCAMRSQEGVFVTCKSCPHSYFQLRSCSSPTHTRTHARTHSRARAHTHASDGVPLYAFDANGFKRPSHTLKSSRFDHIGGGTRGECTMVREHEVFALSSEGTRGVRKKLIALGCAKRMGQVQLWCWSGALLQQN
jgi:hypothetical protein